MGPLVPILATIGYAAASMAAVIGIGGGIAAGALGTAVAVGAAVVVGGTLLSLKKQCRFLR